MASELKKRHTTKVENLNYDSRFEFKSCGEGELCKRLTEHTKSAIDATEYVSKLFENYLKNPSSSRLKQLMSNLFSTVESLNICLGYSAGLHDANVDKIWKNVKLMDACQRSIKIIEHCQALVNDIKIIVLNELVEPEMPRAPGGPR